MNNIPQYSLEGRTALITGAGSGLGKAAAYALAATGAAVAVLSRSADEVENVATDIQRQGGRAMVVVSDISKSADIEKAISKVITAWGRLDILYANAGINGTWAPIEELTEEDWDKTININLKGTFLTIKHALPYLKVCGGSIIVTSSVNGTRMFSNTGATIYACSKAGQVALTKMLALELAASQVRINVICPGAITSSIDDSTEKRGEVAGRLPVVYPDGTVPLKQGRSGTAEEVAQLVKFLASDASSHITGTEIYIDGGQSLLQG